jgi:hypothetical protein
LLFGQQRRVHARHSHEQSDSVTLDEVQGLGGTEARLKYQFDA